MKSRYYNPAAMRFLNSDVAISMDYALIYLNTYAYCINSPATYTDDTGRWPEWLETAAKVVSGALVVGAGIAVAVCTAPVTVAVATVGFGAALGGVVGGIANERNGESYINGWLGGAANGAIQTIGTMVAGPLGTVIGGGLGGFTGSIIIDSLNNIGKSIKKTWDQILRLRLHEARDIMALSQ